MQKKTMLYVGGGIFVLLFVKAASCRDAPPPPRRASTSTAGWSPPVAALVADAAPRAEARAKRDGIYFTTKDGYIAATSRAKLDRVVGLLAAGDEDAAKKLMATDPGLTWLKPGVKVQITDANGIFGSVIRVRAKGETAEMYVPREAVE